VLPAANTEPMDSWRLISVLNVDFRDGLNTMPLEVSSMVIKPRSPVVDELTRHRHTPQLFVPITGQIMGVVAVNEDDDDSKPDRNQICMVPVSPGEALEVGPGTWHTLPFAFVQEVVCLSVMHREDLDSYHDVRDLAVEGWIGVLEWSD
jgi:ureidoglycolate hydrolase